jgi:hypothetical protein
MCTRGILVDLHEVFTGADGHVYSMCDARHSFFVFKPHLRITGRISELVLFLAANIQAGPHTRQPGHRAFVHVRTVPRV